MTDTLTNPDEQKEDCPICGKKEQRDEVNQSNNEKGSECIHHKDITTHSHTGCCGNPQCGCGNH